MAVPTKVHGGKANCLDNNTMVNMGILYTDKGDQMGDGCVGSFMNLHKGYYRLGCIVMESTKRPQRLLKNT